MKNLSIKTSMIALMTAIILAVAVSSVVALQSIWSINASAEKVGSFWIERLLSSREVKGDFADVRLSFVRISLAAGDPAELQAEIQQLDAADIASVPNFVNIGKEGIQLIVPKAVGIRYKSYSNHCYM